VSNAWDNPNPYGYPIAYPQKGQHWQPDPQAYAIDQERYRHDGALDRYGEYSLFVLLWRVADFKAGLVVRCPTCYTAYGKAAEVYQQAPKRECADCFGTTFQGGVKAKVVRTSIWDVNEEEDREAARGEVTVQTATVQSTSDFRLRKGDYVLRADGTRWQARSLGGNALRTGFWHPERRTEVGFNYASVTREDASSVAYTIAPTDPVTIATLDVSGARYPVDFTSLEVINGPLVL